MMTNVGFFIFFLYTIKVTILELLSHTVVQFDPFQAADILSLQHLNTSNVTFTDTDTFFTDEVKILEKRHTTQRQLFKRNSLLDQRIRGNVVPQCPCVIKPGTDKCIAYDSRYQAASIEEALIAFHDVTMDDDSLKYPDGGIINAELFACQTLECQTCAAVMLRRIIQIGMVPPDIQVSISLPSSFDPRNCRRIRFIKEFSLPRSPRASSYMRALIARGLQYGALSSQGQAIYPTPVHSASAHRASVHHSALQPAPVQSVPANPSSMHPASANPASVPYAPVHPVPVHYAPVQPTPVHPFPAQLAPVHPVPVYPPPRTDFWPRSQPQFPPVIQPPPPPIMGLPPPSFVLPSSTPEPEQHEKFDHTVFLPKLPTLKSLLRVFNIGATQTSSSHASSHATHITHTKEHATHTKERTWQFSSTKNETIQRKVKRKADQPVLGTRYTISCIRHGEVDDDNMLALCGTCWTWRKLPSDYFPPLINELVCSKENEGHCLSGWGNCQQKYRNFDVLRNVNGNWQPTTISTATCCDCRIRAGTEIHPLIVGKRHN